MSAPASVQPATTALIAQFDIRSSNVRKIARDFDLIDRIERAISFDWRLGEIWEIPVEYNMRLKTSAGYARASGISLHPGLKRATKDEFIVTFLHEVAHVCQSILYNELNHGRTWWEAMIRLGEQPWVTRFHNIDSCKQSARPVIEAMEL